MMIEVSVNYICVVVVVETREKYNDRNRKMITYTSF